MTVDDYHRQLTERLRGILGDRLIGVWAAGSFGLSDFDPSRSDLDVFAAAAGVVSPFEKSTIAARLSHGELPCPVRGLEFVLYPERTARVPSNEAGFLLNLNTGPAIRPRVDELPGAVERHWFALDRALIRTVASRYTVLPQTWCLRRYRGTSSFPSCARRWSGTKHLATAETTTLS